MIKELLFSIINIVSLFIDSYSYAVPEPKVRHMRVTGYIPANNSKGALGEHVVIGKTAAVSRKCMDLLGDTVYIEGHGVWKINDLTAKWLDDKHKVCTIDLAVPNKTEARKIGNNIHKVVRIHETNRRTRTSNRRGSK
jgi:hypothetical protein